DQVASMALINETKKRLGIRPDDIDGLIDYVRCVDTVVVALFFEELPEGKIRLSARSKDDRVDVNKICGEFGGGGHPRAAGARIRGNLEEVRSKVLKRVFHEIAKASGMTSHDVVAIVRNRLATQKVGHCGTLDPFATGLLLVVVGRGTKIQDLLMSEDKEYVGTIKLGEVTNTQDRDGTVIEMHEVGTLDRSAIDAAFAKFHGDFYQTPPMVSAIKKEGVPLYKLAREGKVVAREPRFVHVYAHEVRDVRNDEVDFRVICSKGFYVRTYAHDIGHELGCGAHLSALRRTKSGRLCVEGAVSIEALKTDSKENIAKKIISLPDISR